VKAGLTLMCYKTLLKRAYIRLHVVKAFGLFSKMSLNIKPQYYRIVMNMITPMTTAIAAIDPPTPPPIAAA